MTFENVTWAVSTEAKELVKSGEAVFSSGGIRLLDGTLKELAVPIVKTTSNELTAPPVLSAMNNYSSTQLAELIKNGTQMTNGKLESVLNMSTKLCLNTALSWANVAINLANCGLAFVFYKKQTNLMTKYFEEQNHRIDLVIDLLNDINDKIAQIDNRDRAERIKYFFNQSDTDIDELLNNHYDLKTEHRTISSFLNEFSAFIEYLIDDYEKGLISNDFYLQSIFLLGSLFTKEVDLFSLQYYQVMKNDHKKYDYWCSIIDKIDKCESLKKRIKSYIMLQSPEISPLEKRDYYEILNLTFSNHTYNLQINNYVKKKIAIDSNLSTFDEIINTKIMNDEPLII